MILWLHWASLLFLFPILLFSSFIRNLVLAKIEEDMKLDEDRILRARALMENGLKIELWIIIRPLPPLRGPPSPHGDGFLRRKLTFSTNIKRQTIFSRAGQFPGPGLSGGVSKLPALPVWDWLPILRVILSISIYIPMWTGVLGRCLLHLDLSFS